MPAPGWRFVRWEGPCAPSSVPPYCRLEVKADVVSWWDANYPDTAIPATVAVFEKIGYDRELRPTGDAATMQGQGIHEVGIMPLQTVAVNVGGERYADPLGHTRHFQVVGAAADVVVVGNRSVDSPGLDASLGNVVIYGEVIPRWIYRDLDLGSL